MMLLNSCRLFFQERREDLILVLCKKWLAQVGVFQVLVAAEKLWVQPLSQVWKFFYALSQGEKPAPSPPGEAEVDSS